MQWKLFLAWGLVATLAATRSETIAAPPVAAPPPGARTADTASASTAPSPPSTPAAPSSPVSANDNKLAVHDAATAVDAAAADAAAAADDDAAAARRAARDAVVARIDSRIAAGWQRAAIEPAARSSDAEFLRRVTLDLTGVVPRVAEARDFLADTAADKRERAIDRLLESPRHPTHLANQWRDILLPGGVSRENLANAIGVQNWLRARFSENLRYDRFVSEFLVVTSGAETGPALFYTTLELKPEKLAAATARGFLGPRIECA